ncbi:hypothetical protein D9613_012272 [Agrocybe pediades]|uniref:NCA2-domain-containing protein n=1 Tax=Agrocybe pediades TaxID=84607 RepID=A0A8H4QF89_9AGAR|nr:hypothetical protein D9613_012272 [Agrocybe pediades]
MPSEFVDHFTRCLEISATRPGSPELIPPPFTQNLPRVDARKQALHALLVQLNRNTNTLEDIHSSLSSLEELSPSANRAQALEQRLPLDPEEAALEDAIVGKLSVTLYSHALDVFLAQATQVEEEAEYWAEIERSRIRVALYLLQTFPIRTCNVVKQILQTLRSRRIPLHISTFTPSSLRRIFPSSTQFTLQPGLLTTAFFPHLAHQRSVSFSVLLSTRSKNTSYDINSSNSPTIMDRVSSTVQRALESAALVARFLDLPLELIAQECRYNRRALEKIRDERAETLGHIAQLRAPLEGLIHSPSGFSLRSQNTPDYTAIINALLRVISPSPSLLGPSGDSVVVSLSSLAQSLPLATSKHNQLLESRNLLRPSLLTRIWPRLLVFPPLALYIYTSRTSWVPALVDMAKDAQETVRGFVQGWLVEPLLGVLHTVRVGGKGEVLVREEAIIADLESLQRMTLSLARDALNYTQPQLEALAEQVKVGDLTPVMQIYEEDIRSPIRSAISGTLLRNAFIQVQKAKVDIDQALAGIDRLLKSQELTFAFVGVAPALAIVWGFFGATARLWDGGKGRGRYGGQSRRRGVWERIRRIERLLIHQPPTATSSFESEAGSKLAPIAPLPTGLLILSLTRLRSYALGYLPEDIRLPFLEDLGDLENTELGRDEKLKVVERMWRCWGMGKNAVIKY